MSPLYPEWIEDQMLIKSSCNNEREKRCLTRFILLEKGNNDKLSQTNSRYFAWLTPKQNSNYEHLSIVIKKANSDHVRLIIEKICYSTQSSYLNWLKELELQAVLWLIFSNLDWRKLIARHFCFIWHCNCSNYTLNYWIWIS